MTRRAVVGAGLVLAAGVGLCTQTPVPAERFTTASLRASRRGVEVADREPYVWRRAEGKAAFMGWTLRELLAFAEGVPEERVLGIGDANDDENEIQYDVIGQGKPQSSTAELRPMLRQLLIERFHLQTHITTFMAPGYALVRSGSALALAPAKDASGPAVCAPQAQAMSCTNFTMAWLASELPAWAPGYLENFPVVRDQTGLRGAYDFQVPHVAPRSQANAAGNLTLFQALERIGLKLEPGQQPTPVNHVDHADAVPVADAAGEAPAPVAFATVSLEPSAAGEKRSHRATHEGGFEEHAVSLQQLIQDAYGVDDDIDRLHGAAQDPEWLASERFDLEAQLAPGGSSMIALQTLLRERFHLAAHVASQPVQVWALVRGPGAAKLTPATGATPPDCDDPVQDGIRTFDCHGYTMDDLAGWIDGGAWDYISAYPVIDLTGLTGRYDIHLRIAAKPPVAGVAAAGPSLFEALRDQLGLELLQQTRRRAVLVIDHVDRSPAAGPAQR